MTLGGPQSDKASLGVLVMLAALLLSAFLGGAIGLVWQSVDWFDEDPADETVTAADDPGD